MTVAHNIFRFFRPSTGLFYGCNIKRPAKYGDIVMLEDDFYGYDAFGVLTERNGELVINMGHKYFVIDDEVKDNILGGVERFYFQGVKL